MSQVVHGIFISTNSFQEFLNWLEKWIGEEAYGKIPPEKTRHGSQLLNTFENVKQHFAGEDDDIEIHLPKECGIDDDEDLNIDGRTLTLNAYVALECHQYQLTSPQGTDEGDL